MKLSTKEQDYLEGSLMPQAEFLQESYALALSRYQWVSQYTKNKTVLDAGCGSGYGTHQLANHGAKTVYGVDINAPSIKHCQSYYRQKNLHFSQGDLTKLKFPNNFFDVIIAFEVIEHIQNLPKAIAELRRLLKPGGQLILSTPNKAVYSPGTKKPFYPFHIQEFYLKDLKQILSPFHIQEILGQYIKGRKMLLYSPWHPKRIMRTFYANLPLSLKIMIVRWYVKICFWLSRQNFYHFKKIKLTDVYFSKNLDNTRVFVAICQKPPHSAIPAPSSRHSEPLVIARSLRRSNLHPESRGLPRSPEVARNDTGKIRYS